MAQIVTITNPLTGQPAQVDQLEHTAQQIDDAIARALPGGAIDIALQNNDPKNWGLDVSKQLTDANDGTRNGFYTMTVGAANVPFDYGVLLVHNLANPNYVHQELTEYLSGIKACRGGAWDDATSAIKWQPWEWFNPPMLLGVEYRTTERYLGKPVYAKVVDCGALPNAGLKIVDFSDVDVYPVSLSGNLDNYISIPSTFVGGNVMYASGRGVDIMVANGTQLHIATDGNMSDHTVKVFLKYVKVTD